MIPNTLRKSRSRIIGKYILIKLHIKMSNPLNAHKINTDPNTRHMDIKEFSNKSKFAMAKRD